MSIISRFLKAALATLFFSSSLFLSVGTTYALMPPVGTPAPNNSSDTSTTSNSSDNKSKIQNIIAKGNQEIERRLNSLSGVASQINSTTKLTASDKTALLNEVDTEISGLNSLKTQLDSATTLSGAVSNAQSIISDYRVYALVLPKIWLIKTADDQQITETKLTSLSQTLQTRINSAKNSNQNTATLQSDLTDMESKTSAAQAISSNIEQTVLPLQPSDYDSDHTILGGYASQLKTAHQDNEAAYSDAKEIVSGLESL